jgi:hypothetical protein
LVAVIVAVGLDSARRHREVGAHVIKVSGMQTQ